MAVDRNMNPQVFFERVAAKHRPAYAFSGTTQAKFSQWKRTLLPKVLATLGRSPKSVPLKAEMTVEWREDGVIKQRWLIDVQENLSAVLLLFRPEHLKRGEKRPAILCCHGHGPYGKNPVMGIAATGDQQREIQQHNYAYGLKMAQAGFVTYSLDWLGFGERAYHAKPNHYDGLRGRDACNIMYLCSTMLGRTVLASNLHDAKTATDFVCDKPFVDEKRLGVMGLSLGGTMTTWVSLYDRRFKASDIICYNGPFHRIAYKTYNVCGSQVTPGLYALGDVSDLQGLIAPQPLLMEIGVHDSCFQIDHTLTEYRRIEKIYQAALGRAQDKLELDLFPREHAWGGNRSVAFFRKHLRANWAPG